MNGEEIKTGTLCYLVNLNEMTELIGRVVTVTGRYEPEPDHYSVDELWVREQFPGRLLLAQRHHLQPICPPVLSARMQTSVQPSLSPFVAFVPPRFPVLSERKTTWKC